MKTAVIHMNHVALRCRQPANGSILIPELGGTIVRTAVVMVKVAVAGEFAETGFGVNEQVAFVGTPLQVSATFWVSAPFEEIMSGKVAGCPAETVAVGTDGVIVKGGCGTPVPVAKIT
jgi:hypothetical protein